MPMQLEVKWLTFASEVKYARFHQDDEEDAEALFCRMSSLDSVKMAELYLIYDNGDRELLDQSTKLETKV
jgi:hypothetical protein